MKIKRIVSLLLCTVMCFSLAACGTNEYKLSKNILNILKRDQVVIEVSAMADVSDKYMQELSKKYDADFLAIVSDLITEGIYAEIQMDNYNGEYEVAIYNGNSGDEPITTLKSVKSGAYINISQLADFLGGYSIYRDAAEQMRNIMNNAEYVRYDYFTNMDKYEYKKVVTLASDLLSTINQCMSQNVYVSSSREKLYFKWTSDVEETFKKNAKRALFTKDIVGNAEDDVLKWVKSASLQDLRVIFDDEELTKADLEKNIKEYMKKLDEDLKENYEEYIERLFEFSDYWDFTYTDATYYDNASNLKDNTELARIELYNYTNGTANGREKAQRGNDDIKLDVSVVFRKLSGADDDYDSFFTDKLGKLVTTPSRALNADIVDKELREVINGVDISNKYDGIQLDVDVNGYRNITSITPEDENVYKEKKMLPLRKVGEALDMEVTWNNEKKAPGLVYKSVSGTYIRQSDFKYELISGKTYVNKSYFEDILGYELFVIEDKIYKK